MTLTTTDRETIDAARARCEARVFWFDQGAVTRLLDIIDRLTAPLPPCADNDLAQYAAAGDVLAECTDLSDPTFWRDLRSE